MNTFIKTGSLAVGGLWLLSFASAGSQQGTPTLSASDRTFIQKAAQGGLAEVQFGKLASQKGQASSVRTFGERMVQDHSAANDKLTAIAKNLGVTPPSDIAAKEKAAYKKLQSLTGTAFDKDYCKMMVQDHHEDIALFQKEAQSGRNSQLKQFALETLPTLKKHLAMTQDLPK